MTSIDDLIPEDKAMLNAMLALGEPVLPQFRSDAEKEEFLQKVMACQCPQNETYALLQQAAENGCKLAEIYPIQLYKGKQQ